MSRPDVALVSPYPAPGVRHGGTSGVASYTANLAHALCGADIDVLVVAPTDGDGALPVMEQDGPVRVERRFRRGATAVPRALAAARAQRPRVVHVQHELFLYGGPSSVAGFLAGLAATPSDGPPTAVTLHHVVEPGTVDRDFTRLHRVPARPMVARAGLAALQASVVRLAGRGGRARARVRAAAAAGDG